MRTRSITRQSDVENEAAWNVGAFAVEEFLGRCECLDLEVNRMKQIGDALPNGGVVIDYTNERRLLFHALPCVRDQQPARPREP